MLIKTAGVDAELIYRYANMNNETVKEVIGEATVFTVYFLFFKKTFT